MDIFDSSGKRIRLTDKHFVAEGGEGRIYAQKERVFKIYLEPQKVIAEDKLDELMVLDKSGIIRPQGSIYDTKGRRVGYSMMKVPDGTVGLARMFTNSYWQSAGITPGRIVELVKSMQETIAFIHKKGFLQVDGNEFNYMVSGDGKRPYFIDIDSYQTPSFPATAIMPSIRDYTQKGFSEETDWFSFAVVAFQLFTGIHPFKGRHPDFKKNDFEGRVKAGVSVFDSAVSFPSTVRDFSQIPQAYLEWFKALFVRGERAAPPSGDMKVVAKTVKRVIQDGAKVAVKQIASFDDVVRRFRTINGQQMVRAGNTLYVGKRGYDIPAGTSGVLLSDSGVPLFVVLDEERFTVTRGDSGERTVSTIEAESVYIANNIVYAVNDEDLMEVEIIEMGDRLVIGPGQVRKILPNATTAYSGVFVENALGKTYLLIPAGTGNMPVVAVPELDAYRIVEARHERGVVMLVVANEQGEYQQARIRFDSSYSAYDFEVRDVDEPMNFAVLDKGIIVSIPQDGRIEVVPAAPNSDSMRVIDDPSVKTFMRLVNDAGRLAFYSEKEVYWASLK